MAIAMELAPVTTAVNRKDLSEALSLLKKACDTKASMPILRCVLVRIEYGWMRLTSTDLRTTITVKVPCNDDGQESYCMNLQDLANAVGRGPGSVELEGGEVRVGSISRKFPVLPADDFPALTLRGACVAWSTREEIRSMLGKVSYAATRDHTRQTLHGVRIASAEGKLTFTATDGHRLAHVWGSPAKPELDALLPLQAVDALGSLKGDGSVSIHFLTVDPDTRDVTFIASNVEIACAVQCREYPNIKAVVPATNPRRAVVRRESFLAAVEGVWGKIRARDLRVLHMTFGYGTAKLSVEDGENSAKAEAWCDYVNLKNAGERSFAIGINGRYMLEFLQSVDWSHVELIMGDELEPIKAEFSRTTTVIMPMRV